jgi:8-oxo-dGTP pyrophosphatase MutT (NUDIX family)
MIDGDYIVLAHEKRIDREIPKVCFWGGMIEWDERPEDGMARELQEETGMRGDCTLVWTIDFTVSESVLVESVYRIEHMTKV